MVLYTIDGAQKLQHSVSNKLSMLHAHAVQNKLFQFSVRGEYMIVSLIAGGTAQLYILCSPASPLPLYCKGLLSFCHIMRLDLLLEAVTVYEYFCARYIRWKLVHGRNPWPPVTRILPQYNYIALLMVSSTVH